MAEVSGNFRHNHQIMLEFLIKLCIFSSRGWLQGGLAQVLKQKQNKYYISSAFRYNTLEKINAATELMLHLNVPTSYGVYCLK